MNNKIMAVDKKEKENSSQDELLKIACERFTKKLKVSNRKLTYDGNGKITACRWG